MIASPGFWFVPRANEEMVVSALPPAGSPPAHPSQYPLLKVHGYPVASRVASPTLARQLCAFPDLVRLVDAVLELREARAAASKEEGLDQIEMENASAALAATHLEQLDLIAQRLRDYLGTTAELPPVSLVSRGRMAEPYPTFSRPHLEALGRIGLGEQVSRFHEWQERDPLRGVLL